jgi:Family of unknown function (DUF5996)
MSNESEWPALPRAAWAGTYRTLHMYAQIVGKIRLGLAPFELEWANVPFYVTARGLTTSLIPYGERALQIDFDFITHVLEVKTTSGETCSLSLTVPRSIADFYDEIKVVLAALKIDARIRPVPAEIPNPIPFAEDRSLAPYDPEYAHRFWQILTRVNSVFIEHRASFRNRHTPVQFFWGTFDLAYVRYSGKPAQPPPNADSIMRASMDAEEISVGFWPGDDRFPEPAFFCYGYPKPAGIEYASIRPEHAFWNNQMGLFLLRYEDVRRSGSPHGAIREFLVSTYNACATKAGWGLDDAPLPPPHAKRPHPAA